jgi:hypothetical protein
MTVKPRLIKKTVTTAGTREQLTVSNLAVPSIIIQALITNTGSVYVGDNQVSATIGLELSAGDSISMDKDAIGSGDSQVSVKDIWLDAGTSGEGVIAFYLERD